MPRDVHGTHSAGKALTVIQQFIDVETSNKNGNYPRRGREARREERFQLACALQIFWQRASGESCTARATCREASRNGALVECSEPLMVRSTVYLSAPNYGLMGNATVRYCRRKGMKFAIALEFTWAASLAEEGRKRMSPGPK
jgi:hypothetical protein